MGKQEKSSVKGNPKEGKKPLKDNEGFLHAHCGNVRALSSHDHVVVDREDWLLAREILSTKDLPVVKHSIALVFDVS